MVFVLDLCDGARKMDHLGAETMEDPGISTTSFSTSELEASHRL